jgi:tetratricopeptide (TPR) repeat protein
VFFTHAQSVEKTFDLAVFQFETNQYHQCIENAKRVAFFDEKYLPKTDLMIAESYFNLQDWENAANNYERAFFSQENDSLKNEIVIKKAICYIFLDKYLYAKNELLSISDNSSNYFNQKRDLYLGIVYIHLKDYEASELAIRNALLGTINPEQIEKVLKSIKSAEKINPKMAVFYSAMIPGLGQVIHHEYKDGINSFAINVIFAGLFLYTGINYSFLDAFVSIFPWFQRYYAGGAKNAKIAAINRKQGKLNETTVQIIELYDNKKH